MLQNMPRRGRLLGREFDKRPKPPKGRPKKSDTPSFSCFFVSFSIERAGSYSIYRECETSRVLEFFWENFGQSREREKVGNKA
jgi:hypothetical protein